MSGRADQTPDNSEGRRRREEALRRAVLAGDEAAWRALYDDNFSCLNDYVNWRMGGAGATSDEIVQETWLVAVRRVRDFDASVGSFLNWLRGIAANVIRNWLRKRRPVQSLDDVDLPGPVHADEDTGERIVAALVALSPRHEAVLRAKYLEGQSVSAIAASWQESDKAIESLLSRARAAFRQAYGRIENSERVQSLE